MNPPDYVRGAQFALLAALLFAGLSAAIKIASAGLPTEMTVFFRNLFGWLVLLPWVWRAGIPALRTRNTRLYFSRALTGLLSMYCFFYALAHLQLGEAVLLNYTAPLFIPFFAALVLRESAGARILLLPVVIGFGGIACILKPGAEVFSFAAVAGLASGVLAALSMVTIRQLRGEPALRVVFYYGLISTLVSAVPLLWSWQTPPPGLWLYLVLAGALATAGQLCITRGYALAPAAYVGPFTYATVAFAAILGWLFWNELPDAWSFGGAGLVFVAGLLAYRGANGPAPVWVGRVETRRE